MPWEKKDPQETLTSLPQGFEYVPDPVQRRIIEKQRSFQGQASAAVKAQETELLRAHNQEQQKQIERLHKAFVSSQSRVRYIESLLRRVCDDLTLLGITVPGYEEAVAALLQETIMEPGGEPTGGNKT